ncbi:MAG: PEP-CTERM sorting domain-containing protein [Dechloromonas sp.]|nr:MAG: PEP-CTERM sorting domain-containing protein [Dechloromonas sp.]
MKKPFLLCATIALIGSTTIAEAAVADYNIVATWHEPETQPYDSIFVGTFSYDDASKTVSNLRGTLSESMTGDELSGTPMTWLALDYQLVSWHDAALGGTFAATFRNADTATFWSGENGSGSNWSPQAGVEAGGTYYGWPSALTGIANPGNAYALIFVPDNPLNALTQAQLDRLAYADCAPGGMMGATCMTGTSAAGYGAVGTMGGLPLSQSITAAVPEPESHAMFLAGLGLLGLFAGRRKTT